MSGQPMASSGPDVSALVERKQLGAHRATYVPTRPLRWDERSGSSKASSVIGRGIPLLILAVIVIAVISAAPAFGIGLLVIIAIIFAVGKARTTRVQDRMQGRELRLHEHGLVNIGVRGMPDAAVRWDEASVLQEIVRHTRNGSLTHTTYLYRISCSDGTQTVISGIIGGLGGIARPDEWGPQIQQAVTSAQLPVAAAGLELGQTVTFGDMVIGRQGIECRGKSVAWAQLEEVRVREGLVSLKVEGRWRSMSSTPVSQIPNFFVFQSLATHLQEAARG